MLDLCRTRLGTGSGALPYRDVGEVPGTLSLFGMRASRDLNAVVGHKVSHALRCDRELLAAGPHHGIGFLLTKLTEVVLTGKTLHRSLSRKLREIEQHETVGRGLFRTFRGPVSVLERASGRCGNLLRVQCLSRVIRVKSIEHHVMSLIAEVFTVLSASSHLESSTLYSRQRGPVPLRKRPLAGRGVDRVVPASVTVVVQLAARCNTSLPVCLAVQGPSASCHFSHVRVSFAVAGLLRAVD